MKTDLRLKPKVRSASSTRGIDDIFGIEVQLRRLVKILHMVTSNVRYYSPETLSVAFFRLYRDYQRQKGKGKKKKKKKSGAKSKQKVLNLVPESSNL